MFESNILAEFIVNLCVHSGPNSRHLIERLVLNFPHLWTDIYEYFLERISFFKDKSEVRKSAHCLATLQQLVFFVPENIALMDKCVGFCFFSVIIVLFLFMQIQMKILPDLIMQIAIKNADSDEGFSLPVFLTRILVNQTPETQLWFSEYLKSAWVSILFVVPLHLLYSFCTFRPQIHPSAQTLTRSFSRSFLLFWPTLIPSFLMKSLPQRWSICKPSLLFVVILISCITPIKHI